MKGWILSEPDRKGTDGAVELEKEGGDATGGNQATNGAVGTERGLYKGAGSFML